MRAAFLSIAAACALIACDGADADPLEPLREQQWESTVETVDGIPVGESQLERAMKKDAGRDEALAELRIRKKIVNRALESPPPMADVHRRQAMVETMLLREPKRGEAARDELDDNVVESVREELRNKMRQPAGHVATLVQIRKKDGAEVSREEILATARELRARLGDNPSDDEVARLADAEPEGMKVVVEYGVQFAALGETTRRPGWIQVSETGAGEIQSLSDGEKVTSAYSINDSVAEFMVKVAAIDPVEPDEEEIERLIAEQIDEAARQGFAKKLVDELVDERSWTMFPETMENELENPS